MNTFMPLEIRDTTASADSAEDFQDCMKRLLLLPYRVRDDRDVGIVAHPPPGKPARDVVCH
jgi:hypothetical protein